MATSFNDSNFEKKLTSVTNTQDGIQTLSLWIIHHKAHHKKIVEMWLKVLKRAKMSHRLTLFNLANDVIQNSRRKGISKFVETFGEILKVATSFVRDDKVMPSVQRIYNIWEERSIYSTEVVKELNDILGKKTSSERLIADFKFSNLSSQLRSNSKLFLEVESKFQVMKNQKVDASSLETLTALKDRSLGQQFQTDFEESTSCLESYVELLTSAVVERKKLLELLEVTSVYYDSQRNEARIVANAYKNFGGKIKVLKKKLAEKIESLPSPVTSPNINAPSPSPSETADDLFTGNVKGGDSPPSPEGTPEEFRFSPKTALAIAVTATAEKGKAEATAPETAPVTKIETTPSTTEVDSKANQQPENVPSTMPGQSDVSASGSLDSRLTNLMENMSGLPQSLLGTLFGKSETTTNSGKEDSVSAAGVTEGTPLNDEHTGRETPLQDETNIESHINQRKEPEETFETGLPLPTLVSNNNIQNWTEPDSLSDWPNDSVGDFPHDDNFPWEIAKAANSYADKDERVLKGVNVEPMDMDLEDDLETNGPLIDSDSRNLITVVDTDLRPPPTFLEIMTIMESPAPVIDSRELTLNNPVASNPVQSVDPVENELLQDTHGSMERQISTEDVHDSGNDGSESYHEEQYHDTAMVNFVEHFEPPEQNYSEDPDFPMQNFMDNQDYQNRPPCPPKMPPPPAQNVQMPRLISYPERQFYRFPNSNSSRFGNNQWANNINPPRRPFRGRPRAPHGYPPYRPVVPPPRWRF